MPVKKKSAAKKRPARKEIKKNIEDAVAKLIAEQTESKRPATPVLPPRTYRPAPPSREKRFLLWTGVATVTCLILVLWVWNMRAMILRVIPSTSPESSLWDTTKSDFEALLRDTKLSVPKPNETPDEMRKKVAAALAEELSTVATSSGAIATTSTATSTTGFPTSDDVATTTANTRSTTTIQQNY